MEKENNLILYGTKRGEKYEDIITETNSLDTIKKATSWAKKNGYTKIRTWKYTGGAPDFTKTIAI